jgi:hypothetical protein
LRRMIPCGWAIWGRRTARWLLGLGLLWMTSLMRMGIRILVFRVIRGWLLVFWNVSLLSFLVREGKVGWVELIGFSHRASKIRSGYGTGYPCAGQGRKNCWAITSKRRHAMGESGPLHRASGYAFT